MRKSIIAGNWKMNLNLEDSKKFIKQLLERENKFNGEVLVCPSFVSLSSVNDLIKNTDIKLGAQNMSYEDEGAFTGEVSAEMLKSAGVEYVILGHSERREIFEECDKTVNKKVLQAFKHDLNPILCVGEKLEEREEEKHFEIVKDQLVKGLENVDKSDAENLVIAYEPVWAIGTGKSASSDDAEEMCKFIREELSEIFGDDLSKKIRIQYGGSVKPDTIDELMNKENIDGALVGGASLKPDDFSRIISYEVVNE